MQRGARLAEYTLPVVLILCLALVFWLLPRDVFAGRWRPPVFAFMFGALVGMAEVASRYRDEPLRAVVSPFGLIYTVVNGAFSVVAVFIILRFSTRFAGIVENGTLLAVTAGFGATVVMRTRLAVIKGPDGKETSIGPDFVINILMQAVDKNVDRHRAARRQALVIDHLAGVRALGSFTIAADYLLAALNAFQNLDDGVKEQLSEVFKAYDNRTIPDDIKYLALGFAFLTIVGERHYAAVITNAQRLQNVAAAAPTPRPASPTDPPAP